MLTGRYRYEALGHKPSFFQRAKLIIDVNAYPNVADSDPFEEKDRHGERSSRNSPRLSLPLVVEDVAGDDQAQTTSAPAASAVPTNFFSSLTWDKPTPTPPSSAPPPPRPAQAPKRDDALEAEHRAGIRVQAEPESDDAHLYRFDYEKKETPILSTSRPSSAVDDLLDFNPRAGLTAPVPPERTTSAGLSSSFDPFNHHTATHANSATNLGGGNGDLLGEWPETSGMARNDSAPSFSVDDPFAQFSGPSKADAKDPWLAFINSTVPPPSADRSPDRSGSNTPKQQRPNYNRSAFEGLTAGSKPKVAANAFDDLLSHQGFTAQSRVNRTIADMRREENNRNLDPISIKVKDWTNGKEKNIRALLSSLSEILWEGAERYNQPSMADLLSAAQVKKSYMKALLVVHPDKHRGADHEQLAGAIFGELNDAWKEFEKAGSPSL